MSMLAFANMKVLVWFAIRSSSLSNLPSILSRRALIGSSCKAKSCFVAMFSHVTPLGGTRLHKRIRRFFVEDSSHLIVEMVTYRFRYRHSELPFAGSQPLSCDTHRGEVIQPKLAIQKLAVSSDSTASCGHTIANTAWIRSERPNLAERGCTLRLCPAHRGSRLRSVLCQSDAVENLQHQAQSDP